jgi:hypothetical protein
MSVTKCLCLCVLALGLVGGTAKPVAGQTYTARTLFLYDGAGSLTGAQVLITLPTVNRVWVFNLSRQFLDLPLPAQLNLLDLQFGLGTDRLVVARVLSTIRVRRLQLGT